MRRNRLIATIAAGLGVIALIPVATAMGDDSGESHGRNIEAVTALGTAFTYQGRLTDAGSPANGNYDLRFVLYDAETAGASVGSTQTKDDVAVANGLFSVDLDFGAAAWNGDARWVEIAVRPGTSTAAHTVLSPRQPISPTPYALFAKAAGGFVVPFAATGASAGAPSTPEGLFTVTQTGTGIGIAANRTSTDAAAYPAVLGTNSGGGAGVQGESTHANGIGVQGFAIGASGVAVAGTAIGASGAGGSFTGPASVELDGPIKVAGAGKSAFVHTVDAGPTGNTCNPDDQFTILDNPIINGDPTAILFVIPHLADGSAVTPSFDLGVVYDSSECAAANDKWAVYIANAGATAAFGSGDRVNVLVIKQ